MSQSKIKITQKEIDDLYEIEETITDNTIETEIIKTEEKPEPEFLTEEEQLIDDKMYESLNINEEEQTTEDTKQ